MLIVFLLCFFFFAPEAFASDADSLVFSSGAKSIPLPGHTAYIGKGVSVGLGGGVFDPTDKCDCMGVWQAQLEFFYSDVVSGSLTARYFGGDLDKNVMLIYQRFGVNVRFHQVTDDFDFYAEPFIGFETTDMSEFQKQVLRKDKDEEKHWWWESLEEKDDSLKTANDSILSNDDCRKLFSLEGFTVGLGLGFGYNISRYVGITSSAKLEYSFEGDVMFNFSPGLAFNLLEVWPWAKKTLRSTWVSLELGGQRYFNRGVEDWAFSLFFGLQLGV